MEDHKKFLEMTLKRFKEILEDKRKRFKSSNAYNEEKKRNCELTIELKNLQQKPIEYTEVLETGMLELEQFITFYSEKINEVKNDEDRLNDIEEQYEEKSQAISEFAKINYKDFMTFEQLAKQKEECIKELAEITAKINSLDNTFEEYTNTLKQQINEYEEITKNINNTINNSDDPNHLPLLIDKKKGELIDLEKKYSDLEAQELILKSKIRIETVLPEIE